MNNSSSTLPCYSIRTKNMKLGNYFKDLLLVSCNFTITFVVTQYHNMSFETVPVLLIVRTLGNAVVCMVLLRSHDPSCRIQITEFLL
jgi:hypothetical protein